MLWRSQTLVLKSFEPRTLVSGFSPLPYGRGSFGLPS